ncbi:MAG: DNA alkylation repair protein [Clostridia bacterium]|nr:DNA alkylation repair protein [Clostridia bacterium]
MTYDKLLGKLKELSEKDFAAFQSKLIKSPSQTLLGVRTPVLRKIAKEWTKQIERLLSFPDEYYEVTFIKLTAVSYLPYEEFLKYVNRVVPLIDNWALCDSFRPKCLKKHKDGYLPKLLSFLENKTEFSVRYALVTLLAFYVEEKYLPLLFGVLKSTDTQAYYVHMAAAWLTAEILVKYFDAGVAFLKEYAIRKETHNKAIQKAIESYRLTKEQKELLKALKIKN